MVSGCLDDGYTIHINFYYFAGSIGAVVSAVVLLTICVAPFVIALIVQVRIKKRLETQLARSKTTVKYNTASNVDTGKNISYEPNPGAVDAKKNIAYEYSPTAVGIRKNVAYETNLVASS